jgi:exosortase
LTLAVAASEVCFAAVTTRTPAEERRTAWFFFAALAALWFALFYRLAFIWETDDQYSHGWMVPLFAGWIFAERWSRRPDPAPPRRMWPTALLLAALWLPAAGANLILESSPEWRPMMWLFALAVFTASLLLTRLAGGAPWLRHFAFPFIFALTAVPWPYDFERWLTLELSMLGAGITGILLNLGGILAHVQGNNIEIDTGVLGVDDACSGVRSFQSSLMAALLFGEWFGFRFGWRIFLAVAGIVVAYLLNIARMLILCLAALQGGVGVLDQWHDPAGFAILFVSMGFLLVLSLGLKKLPGATVAPPPARTPGPGAAGGVVTAAIVVLAATVLLPLSTEAWYRSRDNRLAAVDTWTLAPAAAGTKEEPLGLEEGLGYDEGFRRQWTDAKGRSLDLIYMHWMPGRKAATAGPHAPDWCQRAIGRDITEKSPVRIARIGGLELPYQIYTIVDRSRTFYLLFSFNDGRQGADWVAAGLMGEDSHRNRRLQRVIEGHRNKGSQVALQIALVGESDPAVAERELLAALQEIVVERQP